MHVVASQEKDENPKNQLGPGAYITFPTEDEKLWRSDKAKEVWASRGGKL